MSRAALPAELRGILAVLLAMGLFGIMDGAGKILAQTYSPVQILMLRMVCSVPLAVLIVWRYGLRTVARTVRPGFQLVRTLLLTVEMAIVLLAFRVMPLADAHAILAATPLVVTALSVPLLGERVGPRRWLAVAVGFMGVLLIVRPGLGVLQPGALLALLGTLLYGLYQVLTRIVARVDRAETSFLFQITVSAALLTPLAPFVWITPDAAHWPLFLLLAAFGAAGHLLLIRALSLAPAVVIQPFTYSLLLWAVAVGWLLFGDVPDLATVLGGSLVVAAGLYTVWREQRLRAAG